MLLDIKDNKSHRTYTYLTSEINCIINKDDGSIYVFLKGTQGEDAFNIFCDYYDVKRRWEAALTEIDGD